MREINNYALLSTDVDPQEEDAEKSLDFDDNSEFRFIFSLPCPTILAIAPLVQGCMI